MFTCLTSTAFFKLFACWVIFDAFLFFFSKSTAPKNYFTGTLSECLGPCVILQIFYQHLFLKFNRLYTWVLYLRSRGLWFKTHQMHCLWSLSRTFHPLLQSTHNSAASRLLSLSLSPFNQSGMARNLHIRVHLYQLKYEKSHWLITRLSIQVHFGGRNSLKINANLGNRLKHGLRKMSMKLKVDFYF